MKSSSAFLSVLRVALWVCLATQVGCFEEAATSAVTATVDDSTATVDDSIEADLTNDTVVIEDADSSGCIPETCQELSAECGDPDDGCGQSLDCGDCAAPLTCSVLNRCTCVPDCVGKVCGEKDGCDSTCTQGSGCCTHECEPLGATQCDETGLSTCGEQGAGVCREWSEPEPCESGVCAGDACCVPDCADKECGDDACGGSCGDCPAAAPTCSEAGLCTEECAPSCEGKECGDDGCEGTCGECPVAAPICSDGGLCLQECVPDCNGKECGDDGCEGSCGSCPGAAPVCTAGGTCEDEDPGCSDTCDSEGQTQCWNGNLFQQCGNWDADPCLEWTSAMPCGGTGNCVDGACEESPEPPACGFPMAPQNVITGIGATGSGVCNANKILSDDGSAAEFWSNQDNTYDFKGLEVTACRVIDFGSVCTPENVCVEAWAGQNGCSGDGCSGNCENCMVTHKVQLEIFTGEENSNESFEYAYSMQIDDIGNPGTSFCYGGNQPMRYVLVCRSGCTNPANSYNAFIDYVWLE